jgi:SAM-dependent methyltransferase
LIEHKDRRQDMPTATSPDFGLTADDYQRHRAGFPPELIDRLGEYGVGQLSQDVADIGTGTGSLARLLAPRVASMCGVDPAQALLDRARVLDAKAGVEIEYRVGTAEATGLPDASVDVVTAGQCWHWFDAPAACAEITRVLRPGGLIVIAHFDWLPLPGNVVTDTESLILEANPSWQMGGGAGLYPKWLTDLGTAGFGSLRTFSFDLAVPYTHDDWIGRVRASAGVGGSLTPEAVTQFSQRLTSMLRANHPEDPLSIPHRVWVVIGQRPESSRGSHV